MDLSNFPFACLSNKNAFGIVRESDGKHLFTVKDDPTELARRDCCEFLGGHGSGEACEAVGPCDEFFGGQCCHGGLFTDSVAASKTPSQDALEEGCE